MTINWRPGDVDTRGALIRARGVPAQPERQAVVRDVMAVADIPRSATTPVACEEVAIGAGHTFQAIDSRSIPTDNVWDAIPTVKRTSL